jgi:hypothetical protein
MKVNTRQMLKILHVLSWIIFVGLSIQTAGHIVGAVTTLTLTPERARYFWHEVDLSALYQFDRGYFLAESIHIIIVVIMKAYLFYQIIKILHEKKVNMSQPFNDEMGRFIFKVSYVALLIGAFSFWGAKYTNWLVKKGVTMPDIQHLGFSGADVSLFMGITLYILAQIFKRGIEIQTENELTV